MYERWDDESVGCFGIVMFVLGAAFMGWWLS